MHELGRWAEAAAADHLQGAGCRILARNWRAGRLELDLVVREGDTIAFVEVKARRGGPQRPAEAVDRRKRGRLRRAAARWIASNGEPAAEFRFDVVSVSLARDGRATIRHDRAAFTGDDV